MSLLRKFLYDPLISEISIKAEIHEELHIKEEPADDGFYPATRSRKMLQIEREESPPKGRQSEKKSKISQMPLVKYDCTICNKHYTSSTGLKLHNISKHKVNGVDPSVLCDVCGKCFSSNENLKLHRRIHTGYKPHSCNVCTKSFSRKGQLKEHERVHTGEKPYICKYCGKLFTQRSPLKIHMRTHTGERPYVCRLCNKGYISKGIMDTHMRSCEGHPETD